MKKIIYLWIALMGFGDATKAQSPPCHDFNAGIPVGWFDIHSTASIDNFNTLDMTPYAKLVDGGSSSHFQNLYEFQNLGDRFSGYCLCWDYKIFNDGDVNSTIIVFPRIYFMDNTGRTIYFEANFTTSETGGWVKICAPIGFCDPVTGALPSNSNGSWHMPAGYTCADFNDIMRNNLRISFDVDFTSVISEVLGFDNVCISAECVTCSSDFKLKTSANTDPAFTTSVFSADINLLTPAATSAYHVDWGDGVSTSPYVSHIYAATSFPNPTSYTVCVTEFQNTVAACRTCMDFCFGPSYALPVAGSGTVSCNTNFRLETTSYTDPVLGGPNHLGEVFLNSYNPSSTYRVDWGVGPPTSIFSSCIYPPGPGMYTVCVTEINGGVEVCKTCMEFCFGEPYSTTIIGAGSLVKQTGGDNNGANNNGWNAGVKLPDDGEIIIYPNPASNKADVTFALARQEKVKIILMDINGRIITEVLSQTMEKGHQRAEINTANIDAGVYNVQILIGNELYMKKLLIIK